MTCECEGPPISNSIEVLPGRDPTLVPRAKELNFFPYTSFMDIKINYSFWKINNLQLSLPKSYGEKRKRSSSYLEWFNVMIQIKFYKSKEVQIVTPF